MILQRVGYHSQLIIKQVLNQGCDESPNVQFKVVFLYLHCSCKLILTRKNTDIQCCHKYEKKVKNRTILALSIVSGKH